METIITRTCPKTSAQINSLMLMVALVTIFFALTGSFAQAHPYLPMENGAKTILAYRFHVKDAKMTPKPQEVKGEITMRYDRFEEKDGKRYLRQTTSYRNIPYATEDQHTWRREENGNVYMASMLRGKWNETLELPKNVGLGKEWEYFDGEKSKRKITKIFDLKLDDGRVIPDCLEVTRLIVANERLENVINKFYYCRDIGDSGSIFQQPSPVGDYVTETKLKSHARPQK
jgi:hypothetical protein